MSLSSPQLNFANGILDGLTQAEAYRNAYPKCKSGWDASASTLLRKPKVAAYIAEKRKKQEEKTDYDREWAIKQLAGIVLEGERDRVPAMSQLSKMQGWDKPLKVEHEAGDSLTQLLERINGKTAGL